jgi:lipid-A-disaccharide synthase
MLVILPFEKDFFRRFDWNVEYVGNPVLDAVKDHVYNTDQSSTSQVALLPGSRKQELKYMLPLMEELARAHPEWSFGLATVDNLDSRLYEDILNLENVSAYKGHTYDLLKQSKAAVVTSGTATLETALIKIPQVVIYRASPITYAIGSRLVKTPYISLVNLIANKEVVIELLQDEMNLKNLDSELVRLMDDDEYRNDMISEYDAIFNTLDVGRASDNAARLIFQYLIANN